MKQVRAISFDLDDTLWAIWPVIDRAEAVLHEHIEVRYPDRKSTRLNSSHSQQSRMPSSA